MGKGKLKQGDLAGAISDFDQAIAVDPKYATAYNDRGNVRKALGDLAGAISDYDQAIVVDPKKVEAYYNRGFARKAQEDLTSAVADLTCYLKLAPNAADRAVVEKTIADLARAT